ncbi:rRNA maturation RNase YbeY [Sedimentitalea sp. JM2-8]|uniref:Endoribonuclease YbeY n=1 Tax=Sedimentitalea xiamensis TaxID=3050037 RepID=A0ABT7FGL1_9RHOB|nr:rRNA maturation RNase YbeY [Sedimentitalea xiamensis]MDK3073919.1 rRNA maturation RNase YbeY [Sedimentitalea xiamensis]
MAIESIIESDVWADLDIGALAERAVSGALRACDLDPEDCEVTVMACDDARIAALNREFRGKAQPTNVLSWPAEDLSAADPGGIPRTPEPDATGEIALGDIAIAFETCAREAAAAGKPMADHVTHLVVHGLLHLLGYDHIRDPDATLMERLEVEILGRLGLDDPYRDTEGP